MFELIDLDTDETHGTFETLSEARGAVRFDRLKAYAIWHNDRRVESCDGDFDPENIYNTPSIAQSIAEDRSRRQ
jgi:hypothetical protein